MSGEAICATRGRFWCISPDSDDEGSDGLDGGSPVSPAAVSPSLSVYARTPPEGSSHRRKESGRGEKRMRKRALAREVARIVCSVEEPGTRLKSADVAGSPEVGSSGRRSKSLELLPPSTFVLDNFEQGEWTVVQRRSRTPRSTLVQGGRSSPASVAGVVEDRVLSPGSVDPGLNFSTQHQRSVGRSGLIVAAGPGSDPGRPGSQRASARVAVLPGVEIGRAHV